MNTTTQKGFLVLADITGFTPFVADSEIQHSNEILHSILKAILSDLTPTLTLAEVEGDAVFVYSPSRRFPRSEVILDIIESTYIAYRDRKNSLLRERTCNCRACQMAPSLDLKFIVHYGEYILDNVSGKMKPFGTSVNLAHRLLKNSISEVTGWRAYALFTQDCVNAIGINSARFHQQSESFEHIGSVETFSINLHESYKNFIEDRRVYLAKEDADVVLQRDFPIPPALLWEWFNEPKQRTQWRIGSDWNMGLRPMGRIGKGATNHCVNSKMIEKILDYRPFDYFTSSMSRGFFHVLQTVEFREIPSGSRVFWHVKIKTILPKQISRRLCRFMLEKGLKINESFEKLLKLTQDDLSATEVSTS